MIFRHIVSSSSQIYFVYPKKSTPQSDVVDQGRDGNANGVNLDQTAPEDQTASSGAGWSGLTLFAYT